MYLKIVMTCTLLVGVTLCVQIARMDLRAGQRPASPPATSWPPLGDGMLRAIDTSRDDEALLANPIASLDLENVPLDWALDAIRREGKVSLAVLWQTIESAGIARSAPVSVHLHDVHVEAALSAVLGQARQPRTDAALQFTPRAGVLIVAAAEPGWSSVTRLYDVRDLIAAYVSPNPPTAEDIRQMAAVDARYSAAGEAVEDLRRTIAEVIAPDTWRESGGTAGTMTEIAGVLVIRQSRAAHRQVAALLDELRQKEAARRAATRPASSARESER